MDTLSSNGQLIFNTVLSMTVLATVSVILRFVSKYWTKANYAADDWWILVALVFMFGWMSVEFWGIFEGGGGADIEIIAQNLPVFTTYLKSLYSIPPLYMAAITATKLSLLFLYRRLFITENFKRASLVAGIACVLWWFVCTLTHLLECVPPQKLWEPWLDGPCYSYPEFYLGSEIVDTILDFVILAMPIIPVANLKLARAQKFSLCALFLLGGFVMITGIVRIILVYRPGQATLDFVAAEVWGNIHLGTAIICACIPTYRPLFSKLGLTSKVFTTKSGAYGSKVGHSRTGYDLSSRVTNKSNHYRTIDVDAMEMTRSGFAHHKTQTSSSTDSLRGPGGIVVRNSVEIV